jgi:tetratricopeptide (TPR) repeat protein
MKKLLCIIFLFVFSVSLSAQEGLSQAEKAYDARRYKEAIGHYEDLVKKGYRSYQLYYNLGNSYYRNEDLGKAIYYYELARKLEPDDEDVRINLAIASSKTIDKIDSKENFFISAVKSNLLSTFSTSAWAWLSIFAITLSCLLFFVFISSGSIAVKRVSLSLSSLLLIAFLVIYFLGYSAARAKYENKFAIILSKEVRVMNEPTAAASGKFSLHEGTKIRVVERNGDWLLIKLDNGNEGWLRYADVGII